MANSYLNIDMITNEAVSLWKNSNAFIQNINRQYDDQFAVTGAKIGAALRLRLPNDYVVADGPALSVQDTSEQSVALVISTQRHVDIDFSSVDRTLKIDNFSERYLAPMVNNLAGNVAAAIMAGSEGGVCNLAMNQDGSSNIISPTSDTVLTARAVMAENSVPANSRKFVLDPRTMSRATSSLSGLFNPATAISKQYMDGVVYNALGFMWMEDQTTIKHTTGSFSAGGATSSANQTGTNVVVSAITGTLKAGDIITIDGSNGVNRITKQTTGQLRQFVVTANVISGATSIPVYPAIIGPSGGNPVQYQTVDALPGNNAQVRLVNKASEVYRKNIAFIPEAVTMVSADLILPGGVIEASRKSFDDISMRMVSQYLIGTDRAATRLDTLFGWLWIRPEWAVIVPDKI